MSLTFTAAVRANKPKRNVGVITNGSYFSAALQKNGRAWAWGLNQDGRLGDNTVTQRLTPVSVVGAVKTFCDINGGSEYCLAVDKNGRVWAWGNNGSGQLGNNTTVSQLTPVSILGAVKTFCQISGNSDHSLAIDKNGRAWAWGHNTYGSLGNNTTVSQLTPVSVLGAVKTFCKISGGLWFSIGLTNNGLAWAWGYNTAGQLGNNTTVSQLTPVSVLGAVKTFCQISAGSEFSVALDKNGRAWAWGSNVSGQLGNNTIVSQLTPVSILGAIKTFCQISGGNAHTLALDKNGRAWAWGSNASGQLGNNAVVSQLTPVSVLGAVKTFCKISGGIEFSVALDKNGRAWAWGSNLYGGLGANISLSRSTPVAVRGQKKTFCHISAGYSFSGAIDKNGIVWMWGNGLSGRLGNNLTENEYTPINIYGTTKTFCQISSGMTTMAIDKNGRAWGWGENASGQLGDNSTVSKRTPVSVLGAVKTFCKIYAALGRVTRVGWLGNTGAIDKYGRAWSWGAGGVNGDNTNTGRTTPVSVLGAVKTFCEISGGFFFQAAIDKNGLVWGWGTNSSGQLGDNSTTQRLTPVSVVGAIKTFCKISCGLDHSAAIDKNGRAWAWGFNANGQLGDNTVTQRLTPVSVVGAVKTFCHISSNVYFSVALDKNGRAWGWGYNGVGQLGDGTVASRSTPVAVAGAVKTFCKIYAGNSHVTAIDKNGNAWSWGYNLDGPLGNNEGAYIKTPIRVCAI